MRISIWSAAGTGALERHDVSQRQSLLLASNRIQTYVRAFPCDDFCIASSGWHLSGLQWGATVQLLGAQTPRLRITISGDGASDRLAFPETPQTLFEYCRSFGVPAVGASQLQFSPSAVPLLALSTGAEGPELPYAIGEPVELLSAVAALDKWCLQRSRLSAVQRNGFAITKASLVETPPEQIASLSREFIFLKNRAESWVENDERFRTKTTEAVLSWHRTAFAGEEHEHRFVDRDLIAALFARLGSEGLYAAAGMTADLYERSMSTGIASAHVSEKLRELVGDEFPEYLACSSEQLGQLARLGHTRAGWELLHKKNEPA